MLTDAHYVLVQISGGPGMTLTEVEIVMQELNRHVEDHTQILFGTSVDGKMGNRLSVTLISSLAAEGSVPTIRRDARRLRRSSRRSPWLKWHRRAFRLSRKSSPQFRRSPRRNLCLTNLTTQRRKSSPNRLRASFRFLRESVRHANQLLTREPELTPESAAAQPPPAKEGKVVQARQEVMQFEPSRAVVSKKANRPSWKARTSTSRPICAKTCG